MNFSVEESLFRERPNFLSELILKIAKVDQVWNFFEDN